MQKVFNIAVDIGKRISAPAFEVNTNDLKSIKLIITVTNGATLLNLTDTTVRIAIRKPDNNLVFQDCEVKDATNGKVEVVLENQAYIMPGTHTAEIMCYKGSEVVAVSGTFSYKSVKGIMNDEAVESKSEFTTITKTIEDTRKLIEDAAESGVGVDEQARQEIQEVSAQLAEMPKRQQLSESLFLRSNRKKQALISFTDDDGFMAVFQNLMPLALERNIPYCVSLYNASEIVQTQERIDRLLDLQNNHGWEIMSHTSAHTDLTTYTKLEDIVADLQGSKDFLESKGFKVNSLVHPYDATNKLVNEAAAKVFTSAVHVDPGMQVNKYPLESMRLKRIPVNSSKGLSWHTKYVDDAIANKEWLIWGTHTNADTPETLQLLEDLMDYIVEKKVPVVNIQQGFQLVGNALEVRDYNTSSNNTHNHFIVDVEGFVHSNSANHLRVDKTGITMTTPVTAFANKKISYCQFTDTDNINSPTAPKNAGTLITNRLNYEGLDYGSHQFWIPAFSTDVYMRAWSSGSWMAWDKVITQSNSPYHTKGLNAYTSSQLITDYPINAVTTFYVNAAAATGYPGPGSCTTYRYGVPAWSRQEFNLYGTNSMYDRYVKSDGTWSPWVKRVESNDIPFKMYSANEKTETSPVTEYQIGVSMLRVNGWSIGNGILTTHRIGTNQYDKQEFRVAASNSVYSRTTDANGAWLAWQKISAV